MTKRTYEGKTMEKSRYIAIKNNIRKIAQTWQTNYPRFAWTYGELAEIQAHFEKLARRFGLVREFRENGII